MTDLRKRAAVSLLVETYRNDREVLIDTETIIRSWQIWSNHVTSGASKEKYWSDLAYSKLGYREGLVGKEFQEWIMDDLLPDISRQEEFALANAQRDHDQTNGDSDHNNDGSFANRA